MSWPSVQRDSQVLADYIATKRGLLDERHVPQDVTLVEQAPSTGAHPTTAGACSLMTVDEIVENERKAYAHVRDGDYEGGIKLLARCLEARYRLDLTALPDGFGGDVIEMHGYSRKAV